MGGNGAGLTQDRMFHMEQLPARRTARGRELHAGHEDDDQGHRGGDWG